ncbi:unnamed protein product [Ectocarpus sp. 4 AP-2014]
MRPILLFSRAGGLVTLLLACRRSSAVPCTSSTLIAPTVVNDAAGALLLAQAVNCSGGVFNVSWVGSVTVEETIRVSDGTVLSVVGMPDDGSPSVDGAGEVSLFHVSGGTLWLSGLSLINGFGDEGGAIYAEDSVLTSEGCTFSGNSVGSSGGAVYSDHSKLTFDHCMFSGNTAIDGGALLAFASRWDVTVDSFVVALNSCTFSDNRVDVVEGEESISGRGGAIYASSLVMTSESSEFLGNNGGSGGAIWTYGSEFSIENCTFSNNHAVLDGGVIHADELDWTSDSCTFLNNESGGAGGAIHGVVFLNMSLSGSSMFRANRAGTVGGVISVPGGSSVITVPGDAVFEDNYATEDGGGVSLTSSCMLQVLTGGSVVFENNRADGAGGGISLDLSLISVEGQMTLTENSAGSGGGMYVTGVSGLAIEGVLFSANSANTTGGAISFLSAGQFDSQTTVSNCSFHDNGAGDAGGAVFIAGGFVNAVGCDFDGNFAERAGGAFLASGVTTVEGCSFSGNNAPIGPAASNVVTIDVSNTEFSGNTLWCDDDALFLDWQTGSPYEVACDACRPVECSTCTTSNPDEVELCEPVIEHTSSPTRNGTLETLDLERGYWRSSNTSTEIRECYEVDSCVGGAGDLCAVGYDGPFCAVCAEGYTRGVGYTCSRCDAGRRNWTIGVALVLVAVAVVTGALGVRYLGSSAERAVGWRIRSRFERSTVSQGLKIVIVSWQIVSQFSAVASVTYPDAYETFVGYIDVIDLDLAWMLSAECWVDTNFYDTLLVTTFVPLVVSGLVLISFAIRSRWCGAEDQDRRSRIKHRHATALYLVSFLVYSSASSTAFQTFACDDIDTGESFLRADHSIQCYTTEHRVYMAYAGLMCLVYPFGIPLCYAATLYHARRGIKSDVKSIRDKATVLRALHAPYRRDVYYYEVVECFRRVMLSGIVVFILPNTAGQVMTTFLLSLFFFAVFMVLDPYTDGLDTWLARVGHAIVMMSMFVALVMKVDTEGDDGFSQDVFAGALVFVNCAMVLTVVAESFGLCSAVVREVRHPVSTMSIPPSRGRTLVDMRHGGRGRGGDTEQERFGAGEVA